MRIMIILGAAVLIRGLLPLLSALSLTFAEPRDPELAAELVWDGIPWIVCGLVIVVCAAYVRRHRDD